MILIAILTGILATLTIRLTTDASKLRAAARRIQADLLEFRLYFDEPRLIWQAQMNLVRDNLRLFLLFLPAALLLVLPMAWLVLQLEVVYGLRPLHPGEAAVFTVELNRPLNATDRVDLEGGDGVEVETPAVRIAQENQIVWRVRSSNERRAALDFTLNGHTVRKSIMTGNSTMMLSPRRTSSLAGFLLHPEEPRLPEGDIAWLAIDYPKAGETWLVWFVIVSTASALITGRAHSL